MNSIIWKKITRGWASCASIAGRQTGLSYDDRKPPKNGNQTRHNV
jgi:hypothetical protein